MLKAQENTGNQETNKYTNLKWYILDQGTSEPTNAATKTYANPNTSGTLTQTLNNGGRYAYGYKMSNTALTNSAHGFDSTTLSTLSLTKSGSYYFTIVVWIEETEEDQSSTDKGTFIGTLDFYTVNTKGDKINGITSTITG